MGAGGSNDTAKSENEPQLRHSCLLSWLVQRAWHRQATITITTVGAVTVGVVLPRA